MAVYILEGAFAFDHEGKATMTYKAADTLYIEANKIHEGINKGTSPVKALAGSMGLDAPSHRRTRLVLLARRKVNSGRIKVAGNGVTHGVRATRDID